MGVANYNRQETEIEESLDLVKESGIEIVNLHKKKKEEILMYFVFLVY